MAIEIINELPPIVVPTIVVPGDHRKDCCRKAANLEYHEVQLGMVCYRCRHCGCRHFEIDAEPGKFGIRGK